MYWRVGSHAGQVQKSVTQLEMSATVYLSLLCDKHTDPEVENNLERYSKLADLKGRF